MARHVLNSGWLRTYRDEWLFYMRQTDERCLNNTECLPKPPGNPDIEFDCTWISNNRYHLRVSGESRSRGFVAVSFTTFTTTALQHTT